MHEMSLIKSVGGEERAGVEDNAETWANDGDGEGEEMEGTEEEDNESGEEETEGSDEEEREGNEQEEAESEEETGESEDTQVVFEEHTEVVGEESEKVREEEDQEDDDTYVDERADRRGSRMSRKLDEILAAKQHRGEEVETSVDEEDDGDEIPLIRRPWSVRVAVEEGMQEKDEEEALIHTVGSDETEVVDKAAAEKRAKADKKRKGKQIAYPKKKPAKQASRTVIIQETSLDLIQVPYTLAEEEIEEEAEKEEDETTVKRKEEISSHYERVFVRVDSKLLEKMRKFRDIKQ